MVCIVRALSFVRLEVINMGRLEKIFESLLALESLPAIFESSSVMSLIWIR